MNNGFRAPFLMRWPRTIPDGRVLNGIFSLEDVLPTMLAAVGIDLRCRELVRRRIGRQKNPMLSDICGVYAICDAMIFL